MPTNFYASTISENEQGIEIIALQKASRDIFMYYGTSSSENGLTPPDYDNAANRCAYLYKYTHLHTAIVYKYFRKMLKKQEVKKVLNCKKNIKICCLAGGPGTDVVGIFKTLALFPSFHKRVKKVSVLDVCQGWEDSFKSIMSNLIDGKYKKVPKTFVSKRKFKKEFIQVDLQDPLPEKVRKVISEADIICMMTFFLEPSAERSRCVLKMLGESLKNKALILYIDNFKEDPSESIDLISMSPEFKVVLGPIDNKKFVRQASNSDTATYGCQPHTHAKVSAIGWMKTSERLNEYNASLSASYSSLTDIGTIGMESEIKDSDILTNSDEEWEITVCDKYTQTEQDSSLNNEAYKSSIEAELAALEKELNRLLAVVERLTLEKKLQGEKSCYLHACT